MQATYNVSRGLGMAGALEVALASAASAALGGPGWTFLSNWLNLGHTKRKDELGRLDQKVGALETELSSCEERHAVLETRLRAVEQRNGSHFALWIKDRTRRLVWVNDKAFLTIFAPLGYSRDEIDGKTFADLLDPVAAAEVDQLDRTALAHPGAPQSLFLQLHPDLQFMIVVKVAAVAENGEVQYEGLAYTPGDPDMLKAIQTRRQSAQRDVSLANMMGDGDGPAADR